MNVVSPGRARRHDSASSVAPIRTAYGRSLRPCLVLADRTRIDEHHLCEGLYDARRSHRPIPWEGGLSACSASPGSVGAASLLGSSRPALSGLSGDRVARAISPGSTLSGWWQAARWPPGYSANGGSTVLQTSVARGQRVWKRQPGGGSIGLGGAPGMTTRSRARFSFGSGIGMAARSACVYGWIGFS